MNTTFTGTPPLLRANLKHDGRLYAPWILFVTALSVSSILAYAWIFPTQHDRAGLAAAVGANPALGLIFGPAYDLSTADGFNAWRSLALGGFLAALGAIFSVTRATRAQEDSGQAELLASGVMGRSARLLAGTGMALIGSLLLGVFSGVVTALCGGDWETSILLGATFTGTGWMFGALAALFSQVGSDSRTANSMAVGTLGVLYLLRGFCDSINAPDWTLWINPLGWMQETRPATGDHWWPLLFAVALTFVLLAVGFFLQARRDFGFGVIAPRQGPARGRDLTTWRLALRINRGPIITWTIAFVALGFVFGYFSTSVKDILASESAVQQFLAAGATTQAALIRAFLVTVLSLVGIIAAVPGIQTMLKVRTEEMEERVEPIIATKVKRQRYYGANVVVALGAPALYLLVAGTLIALLASSGNIGVRFSDAFLQAIATVPATWTVVALSIAVIGARPQVPLAAWLGVILSFFLTVLGPTFRLWDWLLAVSPFWHIPHVTDSNAAWQGLVWISLVTLLFLAVGFAGFRRRDLAV